MSSLDRACGDGRRGGTFCRAGKPTQGSRLSGRGVGRAGFLRFCILCLLPALSYPPRQVMLFPTLSTALLALASLAAAKPVHSTSSTATASAPNASSTSSMTPPTAPGFKWLYTANVLCPPNVMPNVSSPEGVRKGIPIVGGTVDMFDGSQWTIRDLGADWGVRALSPLCRGARALAPTRETDPPRPRPSPTDRPSTPARASSRPTRATTRTTRRGTTFSSRRQGLGRRREGCT